MIQQIAVVLVFIMYVIMCVSVAAWTLATTLLAWAWEWIKGHPCTGYSPGSIERIPGFKHGCAWCDTENWKRKNGYL